MTLTRLMTAIWWRRRLEPEPPRPYYVKAHSGQEYFAIFPIRVPGLRAMRAPNMQQFPRRRA